MTSFSEFFSGTSENMEPYSVRTVTKAGIRRTLGQCTTYLLQVKRVRQSGTKRVLSSVNINSLPRLQKQEGKVRIAALMRAATLTEVDLRQVVSCCLA